MNETKSPAIDNVVPWKYHEAEILNELEQYLANTYKSHYVGADNIQAVDLIFASGHGVGFCVGDIIKYAARYGKKKGQERSDILKIIHYGIFLLHLHDQNERRKQAKTPVGTPVSSLGCNNTYEKTA